MVTPQVWLPPDAIDRHCTPLASQLA